MAHVSALDLVLLRIQQMGVEAKARAAEDRVNTTTCMPGTYDKKSSTTKRPCSSPPKFLVTYRADDNKSRFYTVETWWCWRSKDSLLRSVSARENITLSVHFLFRKKASMSKWSEFSVLRIEKISIASLKDVVVLTQFLVMSTVDKKNEASARWKFFVFVRA